MPVSLSRLAIAVLLSVATLPAVADPAPRPKAGAVAPAVKSPAPTGLSTAWTSAEPEQACLRSRRKLWQDGEGWVVKTVTLCP